MTIEQILSIAEHGIALIAFVVSFIALKRGRTKTALTAQEIAEKAQAKAQKYFEKQCKKNHIDATTIEQKTKNNE